MAFALVGAVDTNTTSGSDSTIAITRSVGAGNLVVMFAGHGSATTTITGSDGAALTTATINDTDPHGRFLYRVAAGGGSTTYTITFGVAVNFRRMILWEFSYTGTASLDVEDNTASGTTVTVTSGAVTTTGTDAVVIAAVYAAGAVDFAGAQTINGVAASSVTNPAGTGLGGFHRILSATFASGAAQTDLTGGGGNPWIIPIIVFKAAAAAADGSGFSNPPRRIRLRQY